MTIRLLDIARERDALAWMEHGNCRNLPTSMFFPEQGGNAHPKAKAACASCPVRVQCADYAISDPALEGYWAGTNFKQRRAMRRRLRAGRLS